MKKEVEERGRLEVEIQTMKKEVDEYRGLLVTKLEEKRVVQILLFVPMVHKSE